MMFLLLSQLELEEHRDEVRMSNTRLTTVTDKRGQNTKSSANDAANLAFQLQSWNLEVSKEENSPNSLFSLFMLHVVNRFSFTFACAKQEGE